VGFFGFSPVGGLKAFRLQVGQETPADLSLSSEKYVASPQDLGFGEGSRQCVSPQARNSLITLYAEDNE
jgi:hypothetical protein